MPDRGANADHGASYSNGAEEVIAFAVPNHWHYLVVGTPLQMF